MQHGLVKYCAERCKQRVNWQNVSSQVTSFFLNSSCSCLEIWESVQFCLDWCDSDDVDCWGCEDL